MNYSTMQKKQFEVSGSRLVVNAPAKLNLYLLIKGRRPDGYHEIETLMSKITWYDQVVIEDNDEKGVHLECRGEYWAPENEDNLIIKAANALKETCGIEPAVKITLIKNIPAGTGLGSASSDAAAALLGLNEFYDLGLSPQRLSETAARFGSDTSFFTQGPLAVCSGRGEEIRPLEAKLEYKAVVILPPVTIPTIDVYKNYDHDTAAFAASADKITPLMEAGRIYEAAAQGVNMLTPACFKVSGEMEEFYNRSRRILGPKVMLSGSGSAMYKILDSQEQINAEDFTRSLKDRLGCNIMLVSNSRW